MDPLKALKKQHRSEALARRDAIDPAARIEAAMALLNHAPAIGLASDAIVSGFWPIRSEMDIRPLMFALGERGARLVLPAVIDRETIVFRELTRDTPLVDMGFGTKGPGEEAVVLDPTLMLVPLAAFDRRGHRIGYGAGHYDRAIARLHAKGLAPKLIGIAFDCQEVAAVPNEAHDVPLDAILTESGLRTFAAGW
jgi:5-formyltetrahydrofolate cyclo-ligase